jgi:hypothetical protein
MQDEELIDLQNLKKTLLYFEKIHNISEFIHYTMYDKVNEIKSEISIVSFPMVFIFFTVVLEYYSNHSIPIDYTNIVEKSENKIIIKYFLIKQMKCN